MKSPLAIVVIHPSWPWESRGDLPPHEREWQQHRCGIVLSRITEALSDISPEHRFLIGPFVRHASFIPEIVSEDIAAIEHAVPLVNTIGNHYGNEHLGRAVTAIATILERLPDSRTITVAGFLRSTCCARVAEQMSATLPRASVRISRSLSL